MEALRCPACGAPLKQSDGVGMMECRYCGISVQTAADSDLLRQQSVAELVKIGNFREAREKVLALIDRYPNLPSLWLIRGNCAQTVSERDSSYEMAENLLRSNPSESKMLEIQWTSMVFNWGCELSINDSTFKLTGMERYRVLLPEGEYRIRLRCTKNNLQAEKTVSLNKNMVVRMEAKRGLFDKRLTIE